jgi:hypothetical protein
MPRTIMFGATNQPARGSVSASTRGTPRPEFAEGDEATINSELGVQAAVTVTVVKQVGPRVRVQFPDGRCSWREAHALASLGPRLGTDSGGRVESATERALVREAEQRLTAEAAREADEARRCVRSAQLLTAT